MVAAQRGYLRPIGEWNFQEVTVKGSTIKVELNGTVILDADLSKQITEYMANTPHPGKDRTTGFFGFAGHSDPVAFRAIRVQKLELLWPPARRPLGAVISRCLPRTGRSKLAKGTAQRRPGSGIETRQPHRAPQRRPFLARPDRALLLYPGTRALPWAGLHRPTWGARVPHLPGSL